LLGLGIWGGVGGWELWKVAGTIHYIILQHIYLA